MTNFIDNFIDQNEKVYSFLNQIGRDYESADKNLQVFKDFLIDTKYNSALGFDLANFLQCLNKAENISDFDLGDIRRLYESLIKTKQFNIETYIEAAHFEWSVMDDKEKSLQIIKDGLEKSTEKIEELKRLLDTIQKEN